MKKHKSVVAILLAVMMIFTMMPMMAFADAPDTVKAKAKFSSDYSEVTIPAYVDESGSDAIQVPEKTYKTVRTFADGIVTAVPDPKGADDFSWDMPTGISAQYIDLSAAEIAEADGKTLKAEYAFGTLDPSKFVALKLNAPSYVKKDDAGNLPAGVTKDFAWLQAATKFKGKVVGFEEFKDVRTEQNFTVSFGGEYTGALDKNDTPILGSVAAKNVKVNAATPDPAYDAKYFFDAEDDRAVTGTTTVQTYKTFYDGDTHSFMASAVSGWTAAFSVFDATTGKWNPATAVTLNDVQKTPTQVKVEWTKAGDQNPSVTHMFNLNLASAGVAKVEFDEYIHLVSGSTYDAASYVVASAHKTYNKKASDTAKVYAKLLDAATKKAVEANKTELLAYFNEKYDIKEFTPEYNPNLVYLSFEEKDLTQKELKAIDEKYAALINRFELITSEEVGVEDSYDYYVIVPVQDTAVVALNGIDPTDYEIEFTSAPAKKVIKTKKTKSTKTVKFNVKAESKNGTLVKYKLINAPKKSVTIDANTGKITVKKGLAKGTYTFKVKAYIPTSRVDDNLVSAKSRDSLYEVQTIKLVVQKTKKTKKK